MTDGLRMSTISCTERRNDLHLTTTGVGHGYRTNNPFPTELIKTKLRDPLPRKLTFPCQISVNDMYETTAEEAFHYKWGNIYPQASYKKAPMLTKVNYNCDLANKLDQKSSRLALTMGNQASETHDQYNGENSEVTPPSDSLDQRLQDHLTNGVTKSLKPTETISDLQGVNFKPEDQGVLQRHEPYMTTNNWYHRRFTLEELKKYPKKDIATYWQCEDYPKAWGFGTTATLPKIENKVADPAPMRDRMMFQTQTTIPRLPKRHMPLSSWLKSTYSTTYADTKGQDRISCSVKPLFVQTSKDTSLLLTVPKMYETGNMTYGQSS